MLIENSRATLLGQHKYYLVVNTEADGLVGGGGGGLVGGGGGGGRRWPCLRRSSLLWRRSGLGRSCGRWRCLPLSRGNFRLPCRVRGVDVEERVKLLLLLLLFLAAVSLILLLPRFLCIGRRALIVEPRRQPFDLGIPGKEFLYGEASGRCRLCGRQRGGSTIASGWPLAPAEALGLRLSRPVVEGGEGMALRRLLLPPVHRAGLEELGLDRACRGSLGLSWCLFGLIVVLNVDRGVKWVFVVIVIVVVVVFKTVVFVLTLLELRKVAELPVDRLRWRNRAALRLGLGLRA